MQPGNLCTRESLRRERAAGPEANQQPSIVAGHSFYDGPPEALLAVRRCSQLTVKIVGLSAVPPGVVTWIFPVLAFAGTVAVICV